MKAEARRKTKRVEVPAESAPRALAPLRLASLLTLAFAAITLLPRVRANSWLVLSFGAAAAVLLVLQLVLRWHVGRTVRRLDWDFVPQRVHWVQALMQASVYAYWGFYWREVYGHVPLIAAQILLVYVLDMLVSWFRRDRWILGFGPFPIVLSTNLFMWFRDDWFFLQFLMVATGVLGKEFVKWERDGRVTHVFNPSALSLFVFSIGLIATRSTGITWGMEIAATLGLPPNIYLEVFLVGLVVQAFFGVTLVTLSAAAALYFLNLAYTGSTGTYHFLITNIPIAVFLGLHLLVTDPATSPRTVLGKAIFGALYGAAAFGLFGLLSWLGVPTFYDKLLCVPPLNLTVRALDRTSRLLAERFRLPASLASWSADRINFASMAVWVSLFVLMTATGFLGTTHPGRDPEFWRRACEDGRPNGCRTYASLLRLSCRSDPAACNALGKLLNDGRLVERAPLEAGKSLARACDLGLEAGCISLETFARTGGEGVLRAACDAGDGVGCFVLGELRRTGFGLAANQDAAFRLFTLACDAGSGRGCTRLGDSHLDGLGTVADTRKALESFERACRQGDADGCSTAADMVLRGIGAERNDALAAARRRRACELGRIDACDPNEAARPAMDSTVELLKMGG